MKDLNPVPLFYFDPKSLNYNDLLIADVTGIVSDGLAINQVADLFYKSRQFIPAFILWDDNYFAYLYGCTDLINKVV